MSEPTVIPPTPGRVVWYFPSLGDKFPLPSDGQPLAATVARVWNDRMVNLTVHDADGNVHARTSVQLGPAGRAGPEHRVLLLDAVPARAGREATGRIATTVRRHLPGRGLKRPRGSGEAARADGRPRG